MNTEQNYTYEQLRLIRQALYAGIREQEDLMRQAEDGSIGFNLAKAKFEEYEDLRKIVTFDINKKLTEVE